MNTYGIRCKCGHVFKAAARNRAGAVEHLKRIMDRSGVVVHYRKFHRGEIMPSVDEVHAHMDVDVEEMTFV